MNIDRSENAGLSMTPPPKSACSMDVKAIRIAAGGSQEAFAAALGIPTATLRNWEQKRHSPTGSARTLLRLIEREPGAMMERLYRGRPPAKHTPTIRL
jgi:DNA-binding transcriptional regulator YiaG